jgi:hypothetical protein
MNFRLVRLCISSAFLATGVGLAGQSADPRMIQPQIVWSDEATDGSGHPSNDGHLLTYIDWTSGNVGIRDVTTGTSRLVTTNAEFETGSYPWDAVLSPDSNAGRWCVDSSVGL